MGISVSIAPAPGVIGFDHELKRGALAVVQHGERIGVIADTGSDWLNGDKPTRTEYRVLDAGPGVPVPSRPFASAQAAACAIVEARRAHRAWLVPGPDGLTEFDRRALEFEMTAEARSSDGTREREIAVRFGMHPARYAQQVTRLLRDRRAAARAHNAVAVADLDRRIARRRGRAARPLQRPGARRLSA